MNYLSRFNNSTLRMLRGLMTSCSDNQLKSDELTKILKPYGFKPEGLGTNIMVYTNKNDKKKSVVYKIALDEYGTQNNIDDIKLSEDIPEFAKVYEVEKTGLISVQEYCESFKRLEDIQRYYKKIFKILNRLSKDYLIVDLSPDNIKNYGVDSKGNLKIIDGSDLVPLDDTVPIQCRGIVLNKKGKRELCGHKLTYDDEFKKLVCEHCSKEYNPLEFRKKLKEVNIVKNKFFIDGLTDEERILLDRYVEKLKEKNKEENPSLANKSEYDNIDEENGDMHTYVADDENAEDPDEESSDDECCEEYDCEKILNEAFKVDMSYDITTPLPSDYDGDNLIVGSDSDSSDDEDEEISTIGKMDEMIKKHLENKISDEDDNDQDDDDYDDDDYEEEYLKEFGKNREKKSQSPMKMKRLLD